MNKNLFKWFSVLAILFLMSSQIGVFAHPVQASSQPAMTLLNADSWYSDDGGGKCDDDGNGNDLKSIIENMTDGNKNDGEECGESEGDGGDDNSNNSNSNDDNSNDSNTNDDNENEGEDNSNDDEPAVCEDESATNYGGSLPCTYAPPPPADNSIEDGDAPRQIKKINKPAFIIPVTGNVCSVCFTGFVYKADQETDLDGWIKEISEDDLGFTIQIGFQADDWYEEVIEYGIAENASFILTWYEIGDKEWITSAVDILKAAGVTCFTFAFDANEDPSWIDEAKQISTDLVK